MPDPIREHLEVLADALATPGEETRPPATFKLRWCPECGRTDRVSTLGRTRHGAGGKMCPGTPVDLTYSLATNLATRRRAARPTGGAMTPDLLSRVREAFEAPAAHEAVAVAIAGAYGEPLEDWHRDAAPAVLAAIPDAALVAVIAVVQEDRTREIVEWTRDHTAFPTRKRDDMPHDPLMLGVAVEMWRAGDRIEAKFGGTTHD